MPDETRAPDAPYDVVGIGNALVDVISHEEIAFVERHGLAHGAMTLVDEDQGRALYEAMGPGVEISGGSAANTIVGVASLGGRTAYVGKVGADQLGEVFVHDIRATGVHVTLEPTFGGPPTGRCLVVVTPDAQRTMCTFLGVSAQLGPADVDTELLASARVTYLEGYLWDRPEAKEAYRLAARVAHDHGRQVALTLSDPFCVERHRDDFLALVEAEVDILFANEAEIGALYETDFETATARAREHCAVAALTRSERGSVIVHGDATHVVPAAPVERVVDTTGAGDLYAAGFLFGWTRGLDAETCGRLGAVAAAEVISHTGARPEADLVALARPILEP